MTELGRLQKIELRDIWKTEDQDFTPWLAREENTVLLGEALGLELEVEAEEKEVGPFRADILCKDRGTENWVLIENQLERTDHKHLGQLITYAAGLQAVTIVWIAARFTDEHRAAIDWLNKVTDTDFRFFALEVELWKIADSPAAPKFNIVSKPNEWSKTVSTSVRRLETEGLTEMKRLQLSYWQSLVERMSGHHLHRNRTPAARSWMNFPIGKSGVHISANMNSFDGWIGVEVYLSGEYADAHFCEFLEMKDELEREAGFRFEWHPQPGSGNSRISARQKNSPITEQDRWEEYQSWMVDKLETFARVFRQRAKHLDPEKYAVQENDG